MASSRLVSIDAAPRTEGESVRCRRKVNRKLRAFADLAAYHDAAVVTAHDAVHDREPQPGAHAFRFRGVEGLEDVVDRRGVHSGPGVGDDQPRVGTSRQDY